MKPAVFALLLLGLAGADVAAATKWINSVAGPFRIVPEHLDDCPPELAPSKDKEFTRHYVSARRDRSDQDVWYFTANLTTSIPIDDSLSAILSLDTWKSTGGWVYGGYKDRRNRLCSYIKNTFPQYWRLGMQLVFNDPDRNFPIPPGTYSVTNVSSDFDFKWPAAWFYGKHRATGQILITKTNEVAFCKRSIFNIAPKTSKRRG